MRQNLNLMKKYFCVFLLLIAGFILALWIMPWGVQVTNNYAGLQNGKEKFHGKIIFHCPKILSREKDLKSRAHFEEFGD